MFCYSTTTVIFFDASNIIGTNSWMVLEKFIFIPKTTLFSQGKRIDILLAKVMKKELNIHWFI